MSSRPILRLANGYEEVSITERISEAGHPIGFRADRERMDQTSDSERSTPGRGPVGSRAILVVLSALLSVEGLVARTWSVPLWSTFAFVLLVVALAIQPVLAAVILVLIWLARRSS
jgi:hypothetical protein